MDAAAVANAAILHCLAPAGHGDVLPCSILADELAWPAHLLSLSISNQCCAKKTNVPDGQDAVHGDASLRLSSLKVK